MFFIIQLSSPDAFSFSAEHRNDDSERCEDNTLNKAHERRRVENAEEVDKPCDLEDRENEEVHSDVSHHRILP